MESVSSETINLMRQRRNLHSHTVELRRQAGTDASVNAHRFIPHIGKLYFFNPLYLLFRNLRNLLYLIHLQYSKRSFSFALTA